MLFSLLCRSFARGEQEAQCKSRSRAIVMSLRFGSLGFHEPSISPRSLAYSITHRFALLDYPEKFTRKEHCGFMKARTAHLGNLAFNTAPKHHQQSLSAKQNHPFIGWLFGVPGAIRTRGLSLRRRTLYPAELRRQICGFALQHWTAARGIIPKLRCDCQPTRRRIRRSARRRHPAPDRRCSRAANDQTPIGPRLAR